MVIPCAKEGGKMNTPARLNKQEPMGKYEAWVVSHANIFLPVAVVILFILFTCLVFALTGVSATESGNVYNHFQDVI
jgi:hypothetical protein